MGWQSLEKNGEREMEREVLHKNRNKPFSQLRLLVFEKMGPSAGFKSND